MEEQIIKHKTPEIKTNLKEKKTEAVVNGRDLPISLKHAVAVCDYIRNKDIDRAMILLEEVLRFDKAVPMSGEIGHRKGDIMSGRFPLNACENILKLLKSLKSNAILRDLEIEKYVLFAKADLAPRPFRRFGAGRFKRAHVTLKLVLNSKTKEKNK
jgi:ribosomal protein L22